MINLESVDQRLKKSFHFFLLDLVAKRFLRGHYLQMKVIQIWKHLDFIDFCIMIELIQINKIFCILDEFDGISIKITE